MFSSEHKNQMEARNQQLSVKSSINGKK